MHLSPLFTFLTLTTGLHAAYVSIQTYSDAACGSPQGGPFSVSENQCFNTNGGFNSGKIIETDISGKAITFFAHFNCLNPGVDGSHGFDSTDRDCLIPGFQAFAISTQS